MQIFTESELIDAGYRVDFMRLQIRKGVSATQAAWDWIAATGSQDLQGALLAYREARELERKAWAAREAKALASHEAAWQQDRIRARLA